jgi:hypothetical protein
MRQMAFAGNVSEQVRDIAEGWSFWADVAMQWN